MGKKNNIGLIIVIVVLIILIVGVLSAYGYQKLEDVLVDINNRIDDDTKTGDSDAEGRDNDDNTPEEPADDQNTGSTTPETCTPSGHFETLWVKHRTAPDIDALGRPRVKMYAVYKYTGNCVSDVYIEANIDPNSKSQLKSLLPSGLAGVLSTPSWCDGNKQYWGWKFSNVNPNDRLMVKLHPKTPIGEGTYDLNVGVATGCVATITTGADIKQGVGFDSYGTWISVSESYAQFGTLETDAALQSWERVI